MIDLKELNKLLDQATPGEWGKYEHQNELYWNVTGGLISHIVADEVDLKDAELIVALHNNAKELIRLAEIGKRTEEFMADKKDHDDYMSKMAEFFNKSGARL